MNRNTIDKIHKNKYGKARSAFDFCIKREEPLKLNYIAKVTTKCRDRRHR